jgi:DNA-binding response OmpR family regulator
MKKLLLIEDDRGISDSLTLYLEQSGFSLCKCEDGVDAMNIFTQCKPQLVILDLNLP